MISAQALRRLQAKNQRIFVSDCEGPISKNDNAFELSTHFIPSGDSFFALVSKYDDVLADVVKKPDYKAGDTLRLIPPFLKAYGATNETVREYSSKNILLVPGAMDTLRFVKEAMLSFIVSTSYEQYVSALCNLTGYPFKNVYCTRLDLDKYQISEGERKRLKELGKEIAATPMIEIQEGAESLGDFSLGDQKTIGRLDEIFWGEIPKMEAGKMLEEVNPVGGYEKANALGDIVKKQNSRLDKVMYVGDSITDIDPLRLVRWMGGLTVSFNGNRYAIREAEIAVISENTIVTSILADVFNKYGKESVIQLVEGWSYSALEEYYVDSTLRKCLISLYPTRLPQAERITDENRERLSMESGAFRKTVRGEAVGRLG
jgi:energy-converting hydrogenase A subunit R